MKRFTTLFAVFFLSLLSVSCEQNTDNNQGYSANEYEVNFSASSLAVIPEGSVFGIAATCTRGEAEGVVMSDNALSSYRAAEAGTTVRLVASTEADKVINKSGDHAYSFVAAYPFPEGAASMSAIPVAVPTVQSFSDGIISFMPMIAAAKTSNVIPTIELQFKSIFSVIEFSIPADPVFEDEVSTLKKMVFRKADKSLPLTVSGTVNAMTGEFMPGTAAGATEVCIDFGDEGWRVPAEGGKVQMLVAPFTVPEGGMELEFTDMAGASNVMAVMSSDEGVKVKSGDAIAVQVSRIDDGIVPVTFPVYFPIGFAPDKIVDMKSTDIGYTNAANQPLWRGTNGTPGDGIYIDDLHPDKGVFISKQQEIARAKWHWVNPVDSYRLADKTYRPFLEFAGGGKNSTSLLGGVGIKGIWTGDYFEFDLPVKKFRAGTQLQFTFAVCNKNAPTFWEVQYLDGETWKTTATEGCIAPDGITTRKATWAIPYNSSPKLSTVLTYTNAVASGHLLIRVICVDGTVITTGTDSISIVDVPFNSGSGCTANFYLCEKSAERNPGVSEDAWTNANADQTKSISFTIL